MRSTIIPAQITTVEDMIAGNLNLTQIVLFVSSLFINTFIYALVPTKLSFSIGKLLLMILIFVLFLVLSVRIKQRLVINWIGIFMTFFIRPHIYIFNKNSLSNRMDNMEKLNVGDLNTNLVYKKQTQKKHVLSFDYQQFVKATNLNISFRKNKIVFLKSL